MHTGLCSLYFHARPKLFPDGFHEYIPAFAIQYARSSNMTGKMPFHNEIIEHRLIQMRRKNIHGMTDGAKSVNQVERNHDIAETQSGKQSLAECSDINHPGTAIETCSDAMGMLS